MNGAGAWRDRRPVAGRSRLVADHPHRVWRDRRLVEIWGRRGVSGTGRSGVWARALSRPVSGGLRLDRPPRDGSRGVAVPALPVPEPPRRPHIGTRFLFPNTLCGWSATRRLRPATGRLCRQAPRGVSETGSQEFRAKSQPGKYRSCVRSRTYCGELDTADCLYRNYYL